MTMTKREMADMLCVNMGFSQKEALSVVESFIDIIKSELAKKNAAGIEKFFTDSWFENL